MSLAYPLMRGTPPLLVAIVSTVVQGVSLSLTAWMGILVISFGIFSMVLTAPGGRDKRGVLFAMVNALIIACYTLVDGVGVRLSGAPVAYTVGCPFYRVYRCLSGGWPPNRECLCLICLVAGRWGCLADLVRWRPTVLHSGP